MASTTMRALRHRLPAMPLSVNGQLPADCTPMLASLWSRAIACESAPYLDTSIVTLARQLCTAVRSAGMRAEHVVLALKEHCWLRECSRLDERRSAERTLTALVSLCIREFYRPAVDDRPLGAQEAVP